MHTDWKYSLDRMYAVVWQYSLDTMYIVVCILCDTASKNIYSSMHTDWCYAVMCMLLETAVCTAVFVCVCMYAAWHKSDTVYTVEWILFVSRV